MSKGRGNHGQQLYGKRCSTHHKAFYGMRAVHILYKKDSCELCGFVPINKCQLDVDHINGDNSNNEQGNLQTLCANCHRLKTYLNSDWETKEQKEVASLQIDLDF